MPICAEGTHWHPLEAARTSLLTPVPPHLSPVLSLRRKKASLPLLHLRPHLQFPPSGVPVCVGMVNINIVHKQLNQGRSVRGAGPSPGLRAHSRVFQLTRTRHVMSKKTSHGQVGFRKQSRPKSPHPFAPEMPHRRTRMPACTHALTPAHTHAPT